MSKEGIEDKRMVGPFFASVGFLGDDGMITSNGSHSRVLG